MVENSIFNNIHFIQSLTINCTNVHALSNEQLQKNQHSHAITIRHY